MQSYNIQIVIKGMNQSSPVFRALNSDFDSINKKIRGVAPESDKARQAITGSMSGASQSVRKFDSDIGNASGTVSKFGGVAGTAFKAVGIAVAGAALAIGAFAVKAFQAASNVSEAQNKVNEVFEESREVISNFAKQASGDVGLSRRAALEATGSFGNLFDQLGFGKEKVADMSIAMVRLAADFGSFHNADIEEVILAQTAAFRGEYDAVQRFVPTINAAAVEQRALAQSGKTATKELTLQEKAFATLTLLVEGSGKAMGDFDRTSTGAANSMRIIRARFEDITGTLGEKLLPIVEPLISRFAQALPGALDTTLGFLDRVGRRWDEVKKAFSGEPIKGEITIAVEGEAEETVSKLTPIQEVMKGIGEHARTWADSIATVKQVIEGKWEPHESVSEFHNLLGSTATAVKDHLLPAFREMSSGGKEAGGATEGLSEAEKEASSDTQELGKDVSGAIEKFSGFIRKVKEINDATKPWLETVEDAGSVIARFVQREAEKHNKLREHGREETAVIREWAANSVQAIGDVEFSWTNLDSFLKTHAPTYAIIRGAVDLVTGAFKFVGERISETTGFLSIVESAFRTLDGFLRQHWGAYNDLRTEIDRLPQTYDNVKNRAIAAFQSIDQFLRDKLPLYGIIREAIDGIASALDRLNSKPTPAPAWTPPPPIFGPRPEPAPDQNQGFQTQWGQWREIPGMMNQPVSITAHGKELIGRPPFPQTMAPNVNFYSPLVRIDNMNVASDIDKDQLLREIEMASVRGALNAWHQNTPVDHIVRSRVS